MTLGRSANRVSYFARRLFISLSMSSSSPSW